MDRREEAKRILHEIGMPRGQQNERSALTLLALANIGPRTSWRRAQQPLLRIVDIMDFMRMRYNKHYAPNTRETIRRQTVHQFEQARIVNRNPDDPSRPTNSGLNVYSLTDDFLAVIRAYGTRNFNTHVEGFRVKHGELTATYSRRRIKHKVPVRLPEGGLIELSPGKHNELQAAVVEEFATRFAPGSALLHLGDTARKGVFVVSGVLANLGLPFDSHGKIPDIILYDENRDWLFLIEAVTSHGPVNPKRFEEMEQMLRECAVARIYVTAFLTRADFRKHCAEIAWETEVWIAESPDHMIHFDGDKFLGPYD